MPFVRMTRLFLRRTVAVLILAGAGLPALAEGWNGLLSFSAPVLSDGSNPTNSSPPESRLMLGLVVAPGHDRQPGANPRAPRLRAGYGTGGLHGYVALSAPLYTAETQVGGAADFGVGISFAPSDTLAIQGELQHRDGVSAADGNWQDRLKLSASFRF